jgi:hypothetical protein
MSEEQLPELPEKFENYINKPYGGLFGENVQIEIIQEIVADPYRSYRPKDFEDMIGATAPPVRKALNSLTALGLLEKGLTKHPIYQPNLKSKKIVALTFLAFASVDDRDGSDYMDGAIVDYFLKVLKPKIQPIAIANMQKYEFCGRTWTDGFFTGLEYGEESVSSVSGQA